MPPRSEIDSTAIKEALANAGRLPPPLSPPINRFAIARRHGGVVYVSSMTPITGTGLEIIGELDPTDPEAITRARTAAEWSLANSLLGLCADLDSNGGKSTGGLDMLVFCNAPPGFAQQSVVADAACDLLARVFREAPDPARGAIGARSLVRDVTVVVKASYLVLE